jgi:hypothetical protein
MRRSDDHRAGTGCLAVCGLALVIESHRQLSTPLRLDPIAGLGRAQVGMTIGLVADECVGWPKPEAVPRLKGTEPLLARLC